MKNEKFVIINGHKYDSATGIPIKDQSNSANNKTNIIKNIQSPIQKAKEIQSRVTNKSLSSTREMINRRVGRSMDISRSSNVSHFTKIASKPAQKPETNKTMDIGPAKNHIIKKTEQIKSIAKPQNSKSLPQKTMKQIKEEAIAEALAKTDKKPKTHQKRERKFKFKFKHKIFYIIVASILTVFLIGFIVYVSIPVLSIKIASFSAKVDATYPEYKPDGYKIDGLITFSDNQVTIKFKSKTSDGYYEIKQVKSTWDSSALSEKVSKDSKNEFLATEQNGLTIYTYSGNAAWVNRGILYTITGNAPLSNSQLQLIALSL